MAPGAGESIYLWMYRQGLSRRPLEEVVAEVALGGNSIRPKDISNYWNGWYRHDVVFGNAAAVPMQSMHTGPLPYKRYPKHPYAGLPERSDCWVPCNSDNKPMIRWGSRCMTLTDARALSGQVYLAENMLGAQRIVIDVDGDHGDDLDIETLRFFSRYMDMTSCHVKPDIVLDWFAERNIEWAGDLHTTLLPTSYHLTFGVDRIIPTMHFPKAHVDIIGNKRNSLRYFKNKRFNGLPPLVMDDQIWGEIMGYIEERSFR